MNLELTEDQGFFRATTRKFLESEVPISAVRALYESPDSFDREWWIRGAELGWTSMFVPESLGGGSLSGHPTSDLAIVAEGMSRMVSPGPLLAVNVVASALADAARDGSLTGPLEAAMRGLLSGRSIATWALCEGGRWDATAIRTTVSSDAGDLVLNGVKTFVEAAAVAAHFLVTAASEGGLVHVLVPAGAAGVEVRSGRSVDLTRRFGTVRLGNVSVPVAHQVGSAGAAGAATSRLIAVTLCLLCAEMCGVADRAFEMTLEYGRDRFAFGRPIVSFQALKHRIADMEVRLEGSEAVTDALAQQIDSGAGDLGILASVARAYVGDTSLDAVDDCVQITGGISVTWEHDIHLYSRRAQVDRAVCGTRRTTRRSSCRIC